MASKVKPYTKLERFALNTLALMEKTRDWDTDMMQDIDMNAQYLGLGTSPEGLFKRTAAGKRRPPTRK